jgi:hypothetical protein
MSEQRGTVASQKETDPTVTGVVSAVTVAVRVITELDAMDPFCAMETPFELRVSAVVVLVEAAHAGRASDIQIDQMKARRKRDMRENLTDISHSISAWNLGDGSRVHEGVNFESWEMLLDGGAVVEICC